MQIRIITDDFTSATDGIVAFASMPSGAQVLMEVAPDRAGSQTGVLSVDTDSRHCDPAEAATRVRSWAKAWMSADLLVKQFDSTLRGAVAAECLAAWSASGRERLLVAPAFPATGRLMRGGHVFLKGELLHRTAFAMDPQNPVRESSVLSLFASQGVDLALAADAAAASRLFARGHRAVAIDVADQFGLDAIASRFAADRSILWAGSTGIARALAEVVRQTQGSGWPPATHMPPSKRPWVCVGSMHPVSRGQLALLRRERPDLIIRTTPDGLASGSDVLSALADEVAIAVRSGHCDGLVATGGDTAKAVARALGVEAIRVSHEVEAGIPVSVMRVGKTQLPVVTKAGGFGGARTLCACVDAISGEPK